MKKTVVKRPKISICRDCGGTGRIEGQACPQCGGTGRVCVSAVMHVTVVPYSPKRQLDS